MQLLLSSSVLPQVPPGPPTHAILPTCALVVDDQAPRHQPLAGGRDTQRRARYLQQADGILHCLANIPRRAEHLHKGGG